MKHHLHTLLRAALLFAAAPALLGAQGFRADFEDRLLASHNRERAALGLEPMAWNPQLAEGARSWADRLARSGRFEHSPNAPGEPLLGENLWAGTRGAFAPEAMVGLWIAEKRYFKPGVFPANSTTGDVADVGHYTQVVWRDTREVGCALSEGRDEEVLVCRYSTYGNVRGRKPF